MTTTDPLPQHEWRHRLELWLARPSATVLMDDVDDALDEIDSLAAENSRLRSELASYRSTRTLGGPPRPATPGWRNAASRGPRQAGWDGTTEEDTT